MMRFVLPFIKVLKISRLFCQDPENVETFSSRPRPRPRPRSRLLFRDQDQDHFSCPRGTLRLHPWWSYMAGHMVISHPPRLKIPRLSVVELCVLTSPILYYWQCIHSHCACAVSHDNLCMGGGNFPTYLKPLTPICLFTKQHLWRYDYV